MPGYLPPRIEARARARARARGARAVGRVGGASCRNTNLIFGTRIVIVRFRDSYSLYFAGVTTIAGDIRYKTRTANVNRSRALIAPTAPYLCEIARRVFPLSFHYVSTIISNFVVIARAAPHDGRARAFCRVRVARTRSHYRDE